MSFYNPLTAVPNKFHYSPDNTKPLNSDTRWQITAEGEFIADNLSCGTWTSDHLPWSALPLCLQTMYYNLFRSHHLRKGKEVTTPRIPAETVPLVGIVTRRNGRNRDAARYNKSDFPKFTYLDDAVTLLASDQFGANADTLVSLIHNFETYRDEYDANLHDCLDWLTDALIARAKEETLHLPQHLLPKLPQSIRTNARIALGTFTYQKLPEIHGQYM